MPPTKSTKITPKTAILGEFNLTEEKTARKADALPLSYARSFLVGAPGFEPGTS
jgi:hypothetical protein